MLCVEESQSPDGHSLMDNDGLLWLSVDGEIKKAIYSKSYLMYSRGLMNLPYGISLTYKLGPKEKLLFL